MSVLLLLLIETRMLLSIARRLTVGEPAVSIVVVDLIVSISIYVVIVGILMVVGPVVVCIVRWCRRSFVAFFVVVVVVVLIVSRL